MKIEHLLLITLVVLVAVPGCSAPTEPLARQRPNILLAIADDWSWGHAGAYGANWVETPGFDRVAEQGVLFTRAYTPNPKCAPSRASLLTGRNSWQLEEAANHWCYFPPEFKSYPEALTEQGYMAGSTGKGWAPGIALDAEGNRRELAGRAFQERKTPPPTSAIGSNDYASNFEDFLGEVPENQPWVFWYGATEPHRGYEYRSGVDKAGKSLSDIDQVPGYWPDNEVVQNDMLDYALEVEHFDQHLMRILELLEQRGALENTLIVVTSDHGMPFPRVKGQVYDDGARVPLAVMWPAGIEHVGRVVEDYVSLIDLAPTFIELAGLSWEETKMEPTSGRSLTDLLMSAESGQITNYRDHVLIGKERHDVGRPNDWGYPVRGIVSGDLFYLRNFEPERWPAGNPETGYLNTDGSPTKTEVLKTRTDPESSHFWELSFGKRSEEELYDLQADRECLHNLAEDPEWVDRKEELRRQMEKELQAQGDPRMDGRGHIFDEYIYADETSRNFYERYMSGEEIEAGWVNESDFEDEPLE